jgi:hypothetical protein
MILTNRRKEICRFETFEDFKKYMLNFLSANYFKCLTNEIEQKLQNLYESNESIGMKTLIYLNTSLVGIGCKFKLEFWTKRGWSLDEAKQKVSEIQSKNSKKFSEKRKQNPNLYDSVTTNQIGYWIKRGYSQKEAKQKVSERQSVFSKDKLIKKYGKEKGLELLQKRNEKWVASLYSNNDMNEVNKLKAITIENLNKKYGPTFATEKYKNWVDKLGIAAIERLKRGEKVRFYLNASKQSQSVFIDFYRKMIDLFGETKVFLGIDNKREFYLWDDKKIYFYDFVICPLNLIFEYNGSHVHPNRDLLSEDQWNNWKHAFTKKPAQETYESDQHKKLIAQRAGFDLVTLWDSDTIEYNREIVSESIKSKLDKIL